MRAGRTKSERRRKRDGSLGEVPDVTTLLQQAKAVPSQPLTKQGKRKKEDTRLLFEADDIQLQQQEIDADLKRLLANVRA